MLLKFAFLLASCAVFAHCEPESKHLRLYHVGDVEGKAFYLENTTLMTWKETVQYCKRNGLKLARVESQEQASFIAANVRVIGYWIANKDFRADADGESRIEWDSVGFRLIDEFLWTDNIGDGDSGYCGYIFTLGVPHVLLSPCTEPNRGTFCEGIANSTTSFTRNMRKVKTKLEKTDEKVMGNKRYIEWTHTGDVEGKGFYHLDERVLWEEAFDLCEQDNMTLARVESQIQADFLSGRLTRNEWYWTASKDVDESTWDRTWNSTGFYSRFDINWTDEGRVEGPDSRCAAFAQMVNGIRVKPRLVHRSCRYDMYCLCTKALHKEINGE